MENGRDFGKANSPNLIQEMWNLYPLLPSCRVKKFTAVIPKDFSSSKGLQLDNPVVATRYAAVSSTGFALSPQQTVFGESGGQTTSLILADFDRDGDLDIVMGGDLQQCCLYKNQGQGVFLKAPLSETLRFPANAMASGDMNQDGNIDLVIYGGELYPLLILFNNGKGEFTKTGEIPLTQRGITLIRCEDINGDGLLDIALAEKADGNKMNIHIYYNQGDGKFSSSSELLLSVEPVQTMQFGDMNGDGDLDMNLAIWDGTAECYFNNRKGEFSNEIKSFYNDYWHGDVLALGNMNGDNMLDIVIGSTTKDTPNNPIQLAKIFYNQGENFMEGENPVRTTWANSRYCLG